MSDNLDVVSAVRFVAPGEYEASFRDGWQQGRGAFGGLVMAVLIRALEQHVAAPERPLRALTGEIPAAVLPGPATVRVETLRAGQGVTCAAARLIQGGEVRAHAVGTLGRTRGEDPPMLELEPPAALARGWQDVAPFPLESPGPPFGRHFEFRADPSLLPFAKGAAARAEGWVRAREPGATPESAHVAALVDAWWPAVLHRFEAPRPMATIAFTLHLAGTLADLPAGTPCFHRARALVTAQGYSMEVRELWRPDGQLIALNPQTFAVIR
jgi:hypothetical protein